MGVGESLEVVASFILLGVVLQIDLKWNDNTNNICQKGYQRLWMIRRLKKTWCKRGGINRCLFYASEVYSWTYCTCVATRANTAGDQTNWTISKVCPPYYIGGVCENLQARRAKVCEKFARKAVRNPRYNSNCFQLNNAALPKMNTRQTKKQTKYVPVQTRTERFKHSTIPYLTEILNQSK